MAWPTDAPHPHPKPSVYASPVPSPTAWDTGVPPRVYPSDDGGGITVEPEWHSDSNGVGQGDDYSVTGVADEVTRTFDRYKKPGYPQAATPTAVCVDGWTSYSLHHQGTCSHHGGVDYWLVAVEP